MIANYQCIQGVDAVTQENVTKLSIGGTVRVTTMAVLLAIPALGWGEPAGLSSRGEVVAQGDSASGTPQSAGSVSPETQPWFLQRFFSAYVEEFSPPPAESTSGPEPARRALPAPWDSPPYPSSEYQGSPLIGVPVGTKEYPLMKALGGTSLGEVMRESRIKTYGWVNGSYNWSNANNSNQPTSYWIVPKSMVL